MRDIVNSDLSFQRHRWSREEAIACFSQSGDEDKARLLSYRPYDFFNVYELDGMYEYFYGAMLPSTGYTPVFRLLPRAPGLVGQLPDAANPSQPAPYTNVPKHMTAYRQSNYWCKVLGCSTVADLNGLIAQGGLRDFIRVNEAFHDKSLSEIAQDIMNRNARAIFIAGPSSSGKTTFANRLSIHLRVNGLKPLLISMDDFYLDRDKVPLAEDGKPDLEAMDALDVPYQAVPASAAGGPGGHDAALQLPHQNAQPELVPMTVGHNQPLIIEGIHGLNPCCTRGLTQHPLPDLHQPADQPQPGLSQPHPYHRRAGCAALCGIISSAAPGRRTPWPCGQRAPREERWIFPYQEVADIVFNSALHYELPILKPSPTTSCARCRKQTPTTSCSRILKILNYMLPVDLSCWTKFPAVHPAELYWQHPVPAPRRLGVARPHTWMFWFSTGGSRYPYS